LSQERRNNGMQMTALRAAADAERSDRPIPGDKPTYCYRSGSIADRIASGLEVTPVALQASPTNRPHSGRSQESKDDRSVDHSGRENLLRLVVAPQNRSLESDVYLWSAHAALAKTGSGPRAENPIRNHGL
jgi:hypothetical protein